MVCELYLDKAFKKSNLAFQYTDSHEGEKRVKWRFSNLYMRTHICSGSICAGHFTYSYGFQMFLKREPQDPLSQNKSSAEP